MSPPSLLDLQYTKDWLAQFDDDEDRVAAWLLVNSLDLVTGSVAEREVLKLLHKISQESSAPPIPIFTLRKLSKAEQENNYFGSVSSKNSQPRKLETKFGSDGRTGHLTRDLENSDPERFLDHPTVRTMRNAKVRKLILVDDILGSGTRAIAFVKNLYRHKTLRSWHSFRWIEFVIIAYAASTGARARLARLSHPNVSLHYTRGVRSIRDSGLSNDQIALVRSTCRKFASQPDFALGFGKAEAALIFDYACPNNVPQMLWRGKGQYFPLFPEKTIPSELRIAFGESTPLANATERLTRLGEAVTAKGLSALPYGLVPLILFLTAVRRRPWRSVDLFHSLSISSGLSIEECRNLRTLCIDAGLMYENNRLTDVGYAELRRARRLAERPKKFDGLQFPYYPRSLRGSGRI